MTLPAPSGKRGNNSRGSGKLPTPEGGDFDPFLKAEVIGKLGTKATITVTGGPEEVESEFSDMQLPVSFDGESYSMGLKVSGGNYARLFKRFGADPKKWRGKVKVEVKHFKANDYVAVV
jgi:hypothetical protein